VITLSDQAAATLTADSVRELPVNGRIVVEPPQGWHVEPTEFELKELKHGQPLNAPLRLEGPGTETGAYSGQLHLKGDHFDVSEPFTLLRLGDVTALVQLVEVKEADQTLFTLDNGYSRWRIAPGYHAGVVSWHAGGSDVNHLFSAYPHRGGRELGWCKPWFGGIQPMLMPDGDDEGWPGKLHEETFGPEPCVRTDTGGVEWSGLCLSAALKGEQFRGLRAEIEYLTVGRSNLLKVVYRLVNETGIYRCVISGLLSFCQPNGRYDNVTLDTDGVQLKRTQLMNWVVGGTWVTATNPDCGQTLVAVKGTPDAWVEISDWGQDGGHLFGFRRVLIPPQGHAEMVVYLALADSLADARRYAALGK
jgi:hypothetical protein